MFDNLDYWGGSGGGGRRQRVCCPLQNHGWLPRPLSPPMQGRITCEDKFLQHKTFVASIIFYELSPDIPKRKGTRGQKTFLTLTSDINLSKIIELCPLTIPSEKFLIPTYMQNLNKIR